MAPAPQFMFDDSATFDQSVTVFSVHLTAIDAQAGPILAAALPGLADEAQDKPTLLSSLFSAITAPAPSLPASGTVIPRLATGGATPGSPTPPGHTSTRWFLDGLEIEGFRGINNEGSPLALKFSSDCVSSISAPNGVGKSSIYEALSFALRGKIPKLDRLLQTERPQEYYLNRFHPGGIGTIKLTLRPDNGGSPVPITVTRTATGIRSVAGPAGIDVETLLSDLNREFVLLDAQTFQSFIDDKALDRGRAFSGLLGLSRYSALRQQLQALCNTRSFNTHFDTSGHAAKKLAADRNIAAAKVAIAADYKELVKELLVAGTSAAEAQQRCHAALNGIPLLAEHCVGQTFMAINVDACLNAIKTAEGGPKRERLTAVLQEEAKWAAANKAVPAAADMPAFVFLVTGREEALKATSGDIFRNFYQLGEQIISADDWPSPSLCPACGKDDGTSVLSGIQSKLHEYHAVEVATAAIANEWVTKGWADLSELEKLALSKDEAPRLRQLTKAGEAGAISFADANELVIHVAMLRDRASKTVATLVAERAELEKQLPKSLVTATTAVETARRLQTSWNALTAAEKESSAEQTRATHLTRLKSFLDQSSTNFATAESAMAAARLQKVEPLCQELFRHIMFSPVVPALQKPQGSEELGIRLAEFWGLSDVSAQALLSESYRNGFAVSVYLAAATLYGGAPRFIVLDDVTSSFDAGHQHHLVEVIRTRFSRPLKTDGPQVIFLSHDTLLEKLFNKHSGSTHWSHQRLEGTARTAVLLQSGAVNKVRDATIDLLNMGRVNDAAPRVRQYLEYILHMVIDRCNIPVPLDIAFGDDKRTPGEYLKAIEAAVALEAKAGSLILDPAQIQALQLHSASIVGNFLAHWSTGQTQAFSAPALLGVMQAIDSFPDCFTYVPTAGAQKKFYASLHRR